MSADFGADLEAALSRALGVVRSAAEAAKDRIDDGIAGVPSVVSDAPLAFSSSPQSEEHHHGAAVSFDIVESPLDFEGAVPSDDLPLEGVDGVDAEGIPFPEENQAI